MRGIRSGLAAGVALLVAAGAALAQAYPSKPVHVINGFQPGGPTDVIGRILADHLTKVLGQPFLVEGKPGAAGNIAGEYVANQPPDGYTLYLAAWSAVIVNKALYANLPYDPATQLTPITLLVRINMPLVVSTKLPVGGYDEFVRYAKANPGKLNHGSPGIGTLPHLAAELWRQRLGIASVHVPYRGSGPYAQGMAQGEVQWAFDSPNTALTLMKNGNVKAFAITGKSRDSSFPDVPTLEQLGMPDTDWNTYFALVGPGKLPHAIAARLYEEATRAWHDPEIAQRLTNVGFIPVTTTPEETARIFARDRAVWTKVVHDNNIKAE